MKPLRRLLLFFALPALLAACSTAVEVNAPYRERASIYGLLNVADSVHYIRIQKTFLTIQEPDAYKAARVKDSIYYTGPDVLAVRLFLEVPGQPDRLLGLLERVEAAGKDTGIFHAPDHLVYRYRGRLVPEDSQQLRRAMSDAPKQLARRSIRLEVANTRTGYRALARTRLVYPIFDDKENDALFGQYSFLYPTRFEGRSREFDPAVPIVRFSHPINGVIVRTVVYIPYEEEYAGGHRDTLEAVWPLMINRTAHPREDPVSHEPSPGDDPFSFYEILLQHVDTLRPVSRRRLLPIRIRVLAADSTMYEYLVTSGQYSPITQTTPLYTNVENGLGLLAGRMDKSVYATLPPETYLVLAARRYAVMKFRP